MREIKVIKVLLRQLQIVTVIKLILFRTFIIQHQMVQIKNGVFRWRYHNSSILFCFVIVLLSCNGSKKDETKKDNIQEPLEIENTIFNEVDTITKEESKTSKGQQKDTISEEKLRELIFLKNKDLIPFDFEHNNAVFFKNYITNNITYN